MPIVRNVLVAASFAALVGCSTNPTRAEDKPEEPVQSAPAQEPVHVKVLAFNDLHGHITGPSGSVKVQGTKVQAGGADYLGARIDAVRRAHPNTVVVTAGDMIGASPLVSALFHDEPAIEAMNAMKVDIAGVGNHEFDEGIEELNRMQKGGCHPVDGCQDGDDFAGAKFPMLAANVTYTSSGETIFPGYIIKEFDGVKVGFIGLTLEGTPSIVSPDGVKGLSFQDEADAINGIVPKLQAEGVESIVVLIHEGGAPTKPLNDVNECPGVSGPIVDIVARTSDAVDVFVTGHTHQAYICEMNGKLVTAAKSFARLLTEIDLKIDPKTGDVVERSARNLVVDREGVAHPEVAAIVTKYSEISAPLANKKVGAVRADIGREANADGESPLGRLIADIQLDATKSAERGGAQIAFMNPGGIRASLDFAASGPEGDGIVTYSEAHSAQPFGNSLVTVTLTGQQIHDLLEDQWRQERVRLLQVSKGFAYGWSEEGDVGEKVSPADIKLNGKAIQLDGSYRVTINSYLATGGDGFSTLESAPDRLGGAVDLAALVAYFGSRGPIEPPKERRIIKK